ncbi:MAG: molybdenum cofactor biosynthesis protein MoaE [Thiotrichales bacterium 32-46-8]|nr:MAG: molybdenum cofactor biosynthesis protein MoaE [Thiotrichales bacterium 32-46-8]OYZ07626.1 MAG: molybdenum cofactor biosynthesis protein MoaE [Thiotrichales bacterium 16-46-22]OZA97793.1 MAG: molybdenum cofactor biosynthesis protein MoaE [Thiotrichales bacterium 34-46-19]HQT02969.1 molybdopterin synthase catalytic subunit MoaE [Thiotrichales bacterium]HQT04368.1 molybdopterin synthase catalytic subunit MoaE [Thiotrichales bacterium]
MPVTIRIQAEDFDVSTELKQLSANDKTVGALVSFVGLVRDINEGQSIHAMTLEHYPGMTEKALHEIVQAAQQRWPLQGVTIIHRIGDLLPSDQIVLVITASRHRHAAFESADFLMDFLKSKAPFWKKENTPEGSRWVDARESDEIALARWNNSHTL